jgi:hypothetical protein
MSDGAGAPAAQPAQPAPGHPGYISPEEQARRQAQDDQMDRGMNMNSVNILRRRQEADDAANAAAASGGGFVMDPDTMRKFLPKWQSIADKLSDLLDKGNKFRALHPPAEDEASLMQKKAADAHADAYVASVQQQLDYALAYVDSLKKAIDGYGQQDQAARDAVSKSGVKR